MGQRLANLENLPTVSHLEEAGRMNYVLVSGAFNIEVNIPWAHWRLFVLEVDRSVLEQACVASGRNALTFYSGADRVRHEGTSSVVDELFPVLLQ